LLIDGGVANNAPLSHALALGAKTIYVLPTGSPCELDEPPRGVLPMLLYASGLLIGARLLADVAAVPRGVELAVIPPPCPVRVEPIDFSQADQLIERARDEARRFLDARELGARQTRTRRAAA
jgi:NTE family protein